MNSSQTKIMDYDGVLQLLAAVFHRAKLDCKRGDPHARKFLKDLGAPIPKRRNGQKKERTFDGTN